MASRVVASRVAVVTALDGSRPHGTTVSAFASLSLAPPMALVSLDERSRLLAIIRRSGRFGLNVLGAHQADPASLFARSGPAVQRMAAKRGAGAAAGWAAPALTPQEARRCSSYGNQVV
ncbi:flavin reductase family protein [Streptomyces griseoloalbus]|uniref:flavin reductase family protein n=1 Tax=Streptomyces griseoloalbus TaxID=67303 RepID=UPI00296EEBE8